MMQSPALQDKLCLKFLLVIVPEVFAHLLRAWNRSKHSGQSYRDASVTKYTFLYCESPEWNLAGRLQECWFMFPRVGQTRLRPYHLLPHKPAQLAPQGLGSTHSTPHGPLLPVPSPRHTHTSSSWGPLHCLHNIPALSLLVFKSLLSHYFGNPPMRTRGSGTTFFALWLRVVS